MRTILLLLASLLLRSESQVPLISSVRKLRGVAANVAAAQSSKSQQHGSLIPLPQGSSRSYGGDFFEDTPNALDDTQMWSDSFMPEEKLVAQLLHRRSLVVRPNGHDNQSTNPVHVNITYNVVQILAFSQAEETLSISGWFTMKWLDPRLSWDPDTFDNIREVNVPSNKLWIPDVGVMNGKSSQDFDFSAAARSRLTVNNEGEVTWLHGAVLDTTCPLDVSFFPFDYQTCFLILTPWQSSDQQLLLRPFSHGSAVDNSYLPNSNVSEWEIQSVHFASKKYRSDLNVTYQYVSIGIHLKRQPLYFVVLVLVPFSMLSALACLIFTLDDTGDRLSVALSLVLSMTMYVVIVSSNAPRSMRTLPVLGIFLLDQLGLLSIATVLAVINNKLYSSNELINWQDWVYVISGTGESKGSDGVSIARRYSARFHEMLRQTSHRARFQHADSKEYSFSNPQAHYTNCWKKTDFGHATEPIRNGSVDRLAEQQLNEKRSWLNRHFVPHGSNSSAANSDEYDDESASIHSDANFRTEGYPSDSPINGVIRHTRLPTDLKGMIRVTPFQYGHHPLCNNVNVALNNNNQSENEKVSINTTTIPASLVNNCSSCAYKLPEIASHRSPWVEPLTRGANEQSPGEISKSSYSGSTCSSCSPSRTLQNTISATAAAALAARLVLSRETSSAELRRRANSHFKQRTWLPHHQDRIKQSTHSLNEDSNNSDAVKLATAAVNAVLRAAAAHVHNKEVDKPNGKEPGQSRKSNSRVKSKEVPLFPYRKLAARLDCVEMIAYLLLSTINAIVCLIIMPRFTQDPLPPQNWIK